MTGEMPTTPALFLVPADALASAEPGDVVVVGGDEGRHAADVKRLRVGEPVCVGNGQGRVVDGAVAAVARGRIEVEVAAVRDVAAPADRYVVVQALARGGRDEDAVETMTEVGVDAVIGWAAERSVAKWTGRTLAKWEATARAATKQSRRARLPAVTGPATTADVAARVSAATLAVVVDASGPVPLADLDPPAAGEVLLVVGPEGGITEAEMTVFRDAGATVARLGPDILRSSTAGAAALVVLAAKRRWR